MRFGDLITFGQSNKSQIGAVQQGTPPAGTPVAAPNFGGQPYVPGAQQLQPQNTNAQVPPTPTPAPKPGESADPTKGQQSGSQLDNFADLFKVRVDDKGQPVVTTDVMTQPLLTMDPAKLKEAAGKMNLAGVIDPALAQKALGGDMAALSALLNQSSQNAFLAATTATAGIVEEAMRKNNARYDSVLPDRIRDHTLRNADSSNPVLNHPAAKPLVDAMKTTIAAQNPHLSADAVQQKAEQYVMALNTDINTAATKTQQSAVKPDAGSDFSSFLNA